jgi:hypothetical protein
MVLLHQLVVAVPLLVLTLSLQCVGVAVLIEWLKHVAPRDTPCRSPKCLLAEESMTYSLGSERRLL